MIRISAGIVTHKNKILLFLRDNKPIHDPNCWSLIGGHVEKGETHDQSLIREIEEEISVRPQEYKYLMTFTGMFQEEIFLYHVPLNDEQSANIKLGNEGQKIEFFSQPEMEKLPLSTNLSILLEKHKDLIISVIG